MRDEARQAEAEVSFERRLCQGRIDIIEAELDRRAGGGGDASLVERLPEILAAEHPSDSNPLPERAPDYSLPRNVDIPRRRLEEILGEDTIARLAQVETEEARGILEALAAFERDLSERRHRLHEVLNAIQSEIVRRYLGGEVGIPASPA